MPVSTRPGPSQIWPSNITDDGDPSIGLGFSSAISPEMVADMESAEDVSAAKYLIYGNNVEPESSSWSKAD